MQRSDQVRLELEKCADPEKAAFLARFFQAFPGGYGEGDLFYGVTVPDQRRIAGSCWNDLSFTELEGLLRDPYHECRLTALFILVRKFEKAKNENERKDMVDYYIGNIEYVNNWDLVDSSAYKILGAYLNNKDRMILYDLAYSGHLWRQRIAIIATLHFIRGHDFSDTLKLSEVLLTNEHDLIHKAVGWMLREIGNRDYKVEYSFLEQHYRAMPRTMLRYALEKFDAPVRNKFLKVRYNLTNT